MVDSKLQVLRKELKDLRDSVSEELRSASQQLLSLSSAALVVTGGGDSEVPLASGAGFAAQMSSMMVDGALSAALSADLALSGRKGGGGGGEGGPASHPTAASSSLGQKQEPGLLAQLDVERKAMAKGLEGLISELGACLVENQADPQTQSSRDMGSLKSPRKAPGGGGGGGGGGTLAGPVQNLEVGPLNPYILTHNSDHSMRIDLAYDLTLTL